MAALRKAAGRRLKVRVSPAEFEAINRAAQQAGMSRSAYLLARVYGHDVPPPEHCGYRKRELTAELWATAAECQAIEQVAADHGMRLGEYLSARVFGPPAAPRAVHRPLMQIREVVREVELRDSLLESELLDLLEERPTGYGVSVLVERTGQEAAAVVAALAGLLRDGLVEQEAGSYRLAQ